MELELLCQGTDMEGTSLLTPSGLTFSAKETPLSICVKPPS